jgi:hypothetical protein
MFYLRVIKYKMQNGMVSMNKMKHEAFLFFLTHIIEILKKTGPSIDFN